MSIHKLPIMCGMEFQFDYFVRAIKGVWVQNVMFWFCCGALLQLSSTAAVQRGFVQRAGNIPLWTVSHSDFPLRTENLSEMFHTILGVIFRAFVLFCVTIWGSKVNTKVEKKEGQFATQNGEIKVIDRWILGRWCYFYFALSELLGFNNRYWLNVYFHVLRLDDSLAE